MSIFPHLRPVARYPIRFSSRKQAIYKIYRRCSIPSYPIHWSTECFTLNSSDAAIGQLCYMHLSGSSDETINKRHTRNPATQLLKRPQAVVRQTSVANTKAMSLTEQLLATMKPPTTTQFPKVQRLWVSAGTYPLALLIVISLTIETISLVSVICVPSDGFGRVSVTAPENSGTPFCIVSTPNHQIQPSSEYL